MNDDNIALVLEGGGLRGQFTAGVLDVLQERGLGDAFSCVLGTSAGRHQRRELQVASARPNDARHPRLSR
jgi:predicted patatin/cPLA2 family phospholipase